MEAAARVRRSVRIYFFFAKVHTEGLSLLINYFLIRAGFQLKLYFIECVEGVIILSACRKQFLLVKTFGEQDFSQLRQPKLVSNYKNHKRLGYKYVYIFQCQYETASTVSHTFV